MAFEKKMAAVPPQPFTADGDIYGTVHLSDTAPFKVKQKVYLKANSLPTLALEVKRVLSSTVLIVGPRDKNIAEFTDIHRYTVILNPIIFADDQVRKSIPEQEVPVVTYEEEPTVAQRVISVDKYGDKYDKVNRFPTDAGGPTQTIIANLLAMQIGVGGGTIDPTTYLVNNEGFFVFDNEGNFIKAQ